MSQQGTTTTTKPAGEPQAPRPVFVCECRRRFERDDKHDRRIRRGDDFAGDCWRQIGTGKRFYAVPGWIPRRCWLCWQDAPAELAGRYIAAPDLVGAV